MKKDANHSCPCLGYTDEMQVVGNKSRSGTPNRTKSVKRSQSAATSRAGPSRSVSFTTSPPCHLGVEVPTPILPKRTQSMPWGGDFVRVPDNDGSKLSISAASAFTVNSHNSSFASTEKSMKQASDISTPKPRRPLQQAFTIMPSETGNFMATQVSPNVGPNSNSFSVSTQSRRTPQRSISKKVTRTHREARTPSPLMMQEGASAAQCKNESPFGRSASWDDLGIAIFKSPIKCEVSRRTLSRRRSSKSTIESPSGSRRGHSVVGAEPILLSPSRGLSPRHSGKRSSFLDRSKLAKLMKDANGSKGSTMAANPQTGNSSTSRQSAPRRAKSLHSISTSKPSPPSPRHSTGRARLNVPSSQIGGRPLHDDVSVSASECVPIAALVFAKNCPDKTHLKKAFKDTLDLVGKWKRKSKQESSDGPNGVKEEDLIGSVASVVGNSSRKEDHRRLDHKATPSRKQRSIGRKSGDHSTIPTTPSTTPTSSSRSRSEKLHSSRKKERQKTDSDSVVKDSLADAIEEKEARLEMYLMKTPQAERKKVDRYWIEAFKRNYAKRNDLLLDVDR